jgi:ATP-binding cassette subfamily B multidrug efflux pump
MIKKLSQSLREYKKAALITPVLVTLEVIMEVLIPFLMANLIDYGIDAGDLSVIAKLGIALLIAALVALTFGAIAGNTAAVASAGFAKNLREDMFHNVSKFSFSNIDKFSNSSIITRLTTDVTNVQRAFQMMLRMAARSPGMLIFSLIAAFNINARLSGIFLISLPILGIGLYFIIKVAYPVFTNIFKIYDKLNSIVGENLRGMRVVKSFTREKFETEKFSDVSKDLHDGYSKAEKTIAFNSPLIQFSAYGTMLLLSWFGAKAIILNGNNPATGMTVGQLMSLITYTMQILMSLMMLSMVFVMLAISRASAERIVELLEEESNLANPENPIYEISNGDIEFDDVCFCYSEDASKMCLREVNLKIRSGETVGILGGTGSAKTTLIQLIPRLYDVKSGSLKVGGVDVRDYDIKTLRNEVAVVLQKNVLFSGTIKENLRWGNKDASDEELIRVSKLAQADSFIQKFPDKYDTRIEQGGTNISGGQKQRLTIARALLKKPKILILDDSTSAVDTKTDLLIRNAMLNEIPNTTKLIISQRVASVQDADKIIIMDDGMINAIGIHVELLESNNIYKEVYESQVKGESING